MFFRSSYFFFVVLALLVLGVSIAGQSTLPDHPTPLTSNAISGVIPARDVGDARLTTHYFWFDGGQGDVFVNLVTKNFSGDVDLFIQNGLRPLTKIVVYPDFGEVETGRAIYLRKPERLLLRINGRTPNDEPAEYRFKFAGSFIAATGDTATPELPKVSSETTGAVRVNSVGTILPPLPKPVETEPMPPPQADEEKVAERAEEPKPIDPPPAEKEAPREEKKLEVVVTDPIKAEDKSGVEKTPRPTTRRARNTRNRRTTPVETARTAPVKTEAPPEADADKVTAEKEVEGDPPTPASEKATPPADPLANVQLVIEFRDGRKIERPLTEVLRFSVERGVLTVVSKNGRTGKYSMLDVLNVTIK